MKTAVLYRTHFINDEISNELRKLTTELVNQEVSLLFGPSKEVMPRLDWVRSLSVSDQDLRELGYGYGDTISDDGWKFPVSPIMRHCEYPALWFFKNYPNYDYYWLVDYDVRFTGNWSIFFEAFSGKDKFDMLGTYVGSPVEFPNWVHWHKVDVPLETRLKMFFSMVRFSNRALEFLDREYRKGRTGFCELICSSLLAEAGYSVGDFWGYPKFRVPGVETKFYTSDSFLWRPCFSVPGNEKNMLYHPVKPV